MKSLIDRVSEKHSSRNSAFVGFTSVEKSVESSYETSLEKSSKAAFSAYKHQDAKTGTGVADTNRLEPRVLHLMYENNPIVRRAVDVIISEIISTKWKIVPVSHERNDVLEDTEKELQTKIRDFFEYINEDGETFRTIMKKFLYDILVVDRGVLEKVRSPNGKELKELYAINGGEIKIVKDIHGKTLRYVQDLSSAGVTGLKQVEFKPDELVVFMNRPRTKSAYGFPVLETIHRTVTAYVYAEGYNRQYFENSNTPRGILDLGKNIREDQLDRFREFWEAENTGKPHRTMVLGGAAGEVKWIQVSNTSKDMELMQYLNWLTKIILLAFGVTPSEVGMTDDASRSPATSQIFQSQAFKSATVYPMLEDIAELFTLRILRQEFNAYDFEFRFEPEMSLSDKLTKANIDATRIGSGVTTPDEVRIGEGLDPLPQPQMQQGLPAQAPIPPAEQPTQEQIQADQTEFDNKENPFGFTTPEERGLNTEGDYQNYASNSLERPYGEINRVDKPLIQEKYNDLKDKLNDLLDSKVKNYNSPGIKSALSKVKEAIGDYLDTRK